ncbi:MAG: hypothetical protein QNJ31_09085 [Candidatus Caenarcaniphilales bacterium]|nr:hypothetical protein [Candidatus Caenarcaniphilales bacterium]
MFLALASLKRPSKLSFHALLLHKRWIEKFLIKELEERHVLIIDNASFHKSPRVRESQIQERNATI